MNGNLNYYMMKETHQLDIDDKKHIQVCAICPEIIKSSSFKLLEDSKPGKITLKTWSYKYEFMKRFNIFIDMIKTNTENNEKLINEIDECPYCECKFKDKEEKNLFYYIPGVSYCFSPFINHMMEIHNYKPPEKFIEYILLKINSPFSYLKIKQDTLNFFEFFDGPDILSNYKFINKTIGTYYYNQTQDEIDYINQEYKKLITSDQTDYIIPELNKSISKQYITTEILGSFVIKNKYDKFFDINKININNMTNDKDRQINNGIKDDTYYYKPDLTDKNKIIYHTHPNYTQGTKYIKDRIIKENVLFEIFSLPDVIGFIKLLKEPKNGMNTSIIFTQEGIYQLIPSPSIDLKIITIEKIKSVFNTILKFINEKNKQLKYLLFDILDNGTYVKNNLFHNYIYNNKFYFDYLKKQFELLGIELIFYPKELKCNDIWGYGDIYLPFDNNFKSQL